MAKAAAAEAGVAMPPAAPTCVRLWYPCFSCMWLRNAIIVGKSGDRRPVIGVAARISFGGEGFCDRNGFRKTRLIYGDIAALYQCFYHIRWRWTEEASSDFDTRNLGHDLVRNNNVTLGIAENPVQAVADKG